MKKTVFLDRDGTINVDTGYIHDVDNLILIDGAAEAIKRLKPHYNIIVISNQSGISRGFYEHSHVKMVNKRLEEYLLEYHEDAMYDGLLYCPHQKSDKCKCRKPEKGMFLEAVKRYNIKLEGSWMVGDRSTDIEAGIAIGAKTIMLPEPHDAPPLTAEPDYKCDTLLEASEIILKIDQIS